MDSDLNVDLIVQLITSYKADPESVYNTWFSGSDERLKAFRSIRLGVKKTYTAIAAGTFGNDFRGSPLEVVMTAITEQKQVFVGAAHAFYWKPKLRIPDIYENEDNKRKFGNFLELCYSNSREDQVLEQLSRLASHEIKGLGPAVANIVYFLHPTIILPFNTAMVNGFNVLTGEKIKLGSWKSYLEMREICAELNSNPQLKSLLSKDFGALAGLLFEIGSGRIVFGGNYESVLSQVNERAKNIAKTRHNEVLSEQLEESEHTQIQHVLIKIGRALKLNVHVAKNDRHKSCNGEAFAQLTLAELPLRERMHQDVYDTIGLIDVLWLDQEGRIVSAFEVEKSTSIYSGILRMEDLMRTLPDHNCNFFLVAPDSRENEVVAQFQRPAFKQSLSEMALSYIPFTELRTHCEGLCKFGDDHKIMYKIARHCTCPN